MQDSSMKKGSWLPNEEHATTSSSTEKAIFLHATTNKFSNYSIQSYIKSPKLYFWCGKFNFKPSSSCHTICLIKKALLIVALDVLRNIICQKRRISFLQIIQPIGDIEGFELRQGSMSSLSCSNFRGESVHN